MLLDFQAIGRVVECVRSADPELGDQYQVPNDIESADRAADWKAVRHARAELSNSISWAYTLRDVYPDWTSDSRAKRRYEALGRVRRLSRELLALIKDDELPLTASLSRCFPLTGDNGLSQVMTGLKRLRSAAKDERERLFAAGFHEAAPLSDVEGNSANFATAGGSFISALGKAFEEGFGQAPSLKFTSAREPCGPFVQFVEAVTKEMGAPMSRDAVRKAWDRANASGQTSQKE